MKYLLLLLLALPAQAFEATGTAENFDAAEKAKSFLRFGLDTKKMGIFKSRVTGFVKKFSAKGKIEGNKLTDAVITFAVREMDTDLYQRNDQMWNYCMGNKENPEVKVSIPALTFREGVTEKVTAMLNSRGKDHPFPLEIKLEKKDRRWVASGKAQSSFKQLEIPDPSIAVASVNGEIDVDFVLEDSGK